MVAAFSLSKPTPIKIPPQFLVDDDDSISSNWAYYYDILSRRWISVVTYNSNLEMSVLIIGEDGELIQSIGPARHQLVSYASITPVHDGSVLRLCGAALHPCYFLLNFRRASSKSPAKLIECDQVNDLAEEKALVSFGGFSLGNVNADQLFLRPHSTIHTYKNFLVTSNDDASDIIVYKLKTAEKLLRVLTLTQMKPFVFRNRYFPFQYQQWIVLQRFVAAEYSTMYVLRGTKQLFYLNLDTLKLIKGPSIQAGVLAQSTVSADGHHYLLQSKPSTNQRNEKHFIIVLEAINMRTGKSSRVWSVSSPTDVVAFQTIGNELLLRSIDRYSILVSKGSRELEQENSHRGRITSPPIEDDIQTDHHLNQFSDTENPEKDSCCTS